MNTRLLYPVTFLLSLALLLAACSPTSGLPQAEEPSADSIATQVAFLLTASPVFTPIPPLPSTDTPPQQPAEQLVFTATPTAPLPTQEPTPLPTETPTLAPSPTPLPTSTPIATDPRQLLGSPKWQDKTFKDNQNWGSAWEGDFTEGKFVDNRLVFTSVGVDGWTLSWPKIENFYMEMTATTGTCSGKDRYGLIVRVPDTYDRGYLYGFTCDGYYSLRRWNPEEKRYEALVNWTATPHIVQGSNQVNRLGLRVEGGRFQMYANGHYLGEAADSLLKEGRFGPFIGHDKTDNFTIYISEIAYWDLP
jgi:hypothetical protein